MSQYEKYKKSSISGYQASELYYQFAWFCPDTDKVLNDYGAGEVYTALEVHTVSRIEDNPGITVTEIAERTARTKGAVSQIITKLENKGLVRREKDPDNPRRVCLYVTPQGLELSKLHKEYDEKIMAPAIDRWIALFGYDAVEKHFMIIQDYINQYIEINKKQQNSGAAK